MAQSSSTSEIPKKSCPNPKPLISQELYYITAREDGDLPANGTEFFQWKPQGNCCSGGLWQPGPASGGFASQWNHCKSLGWGEVHCHHHSSESNHARMSHSPDPAGVSPLPLLWVRAVTVWTARTAQLYVQDPATWPQHDCRGQYWEIGEVTLLWHFL